ncbi:PqqD family protein [Oribacterium sp. P6A1]|uniref:PqqD family protein n=1 Tax=Oribacterium sp. P6A1 TaxID=1410612 RepID=UPI000567FD5A|nr:PqqD family protein [Oribacterium sp. P6A1]
MNNKDNFLDYIFEINSDLNWTISSSGEVIVEMENKGFTNRIAQKFFKKPAVSHIHLQGMGNFIFGCVDGKRSVFEIGTLLKEEYGDQAEPLYERLCLYMKQLQNTGFIIKIGIKEKE